MDNKNMDETIKDEKNEIKSSASDEVIDPEKAKAFAINPGKREDEMLRVEELHKELQDKQLISLMMHQMQLMLH